VKAREIYGREEVPLLTAAEAAGADRAAQQRFGVAGRVLMENAGRAAALVLARLFPRGRVVGVVGPGNNGGDALVLLRHLRAWGRDVAWVAGDDRSLDASLLHGFDIPRHAAAEAGDVFREADVLVDGILGTGATGAPREPAAALIRQLNGAGPPIVALDLPSGVDATTGAVPAEAIQATLTITFGWPKLGLLFHPARARCGRLVAVEIGFPPDAAPPAAQLITPAWAARRLPARAPDAHKGSTGMLAVVAGSEGMAGAAAIAATAAYRAGAGLVRIVSPESNRRVLQTRVPGAVFRAAEAESVAEFVAGADALVVGPGLGTTDRSRALLDTALSAGAGRPLLLDADALNLIGGDHDRLRELAAAGGVALTPHLKEMARLCGMDAAEVRADPIGAAAALAAGTGCAVLLKGQPSIVAQAGAPLLVNTTGSSDLATAGMGDQLAGAAGAFMAAGAAPRDAAALGLFYGGRAADLAALGRSLLPDDVSEAMALALAWPGRKTPPLRLPFIVFDQPPPH
jgi:ADP-dependent NAD(P)H-hydrate dehydratase / NAD(P)H-hydrate epimerase